MSLVNTANPRFYLDCLLILALVALLVWWWFRLTPSMFRLIYWNTCRPYTYPEDADLPMPQRRVHHSILPWLKLEVLVLQILWVMMSAAVSLTLLGVIVIIGLC